jgi:hypothetical protein
LDEFEDLLLQVIDKTIRQIFGDINASIIYDYLKKKDCAFHEIPTKPNVFSTELRSILGSSRGKILGAASILEEAILEALCAELKVTFDSTGSFSDHIKKLRDVYNRRRDNSARPTFKSESLKPDPHFTQMPLQKTVGEATARRKDKNHHC